MIKINGLTVMYGSKKVLNNVNAEVENGKVIGIIGLNGSGKTTFFNTLCKLVRPITGHITLDNKPISKEDIAYLETSNFYYPYLTGREYLSLFRQTNAQFDIEKFQKIFDLPLDQLIENYSTGMKKKLAIIALLKKDKKIFILDEPFNGLDMESNKVVEIIIDLLKNKQKTIFISSHIIAPLLNICNEMYLLKDGQFSKHYNKNEFDNIDEDLFGNFGAEAKLYLDGSI